ncbi:MAG: substrate-binding domain-containing protein [Verrucomicrobia bacterium]|nr:substrate-binding domain-containing protein [Verrucomicrobiota bacterium]MCH8510530.1 substrate-binding domain-containing protein [Kiritimatiellia bacterium]
MKKVRVMSPYEGSLGLKMIEGIAEYMRLHEAWQLDIPGVTDSRQWPDVNEWEGDGIILPVVLKSTLESLTRIKIPFVNITVRPGVPTVQNDNHAMGRMAAEHLLAQGYRNFAMITNRHMPFAVQRCEGFAEHLREKGWPVEMIDTHQSPGEIRDHFSRRRSRKDAFPMGVLIYSDLISPTVYQEIQALDYSIPEQVAVIGMDDRLIGLTLSPTLTSVVPDGFRLGFRAAEMLHMQFQGQRPPDAPILIPPMGINERGSTHAFGFEDEHVAAALKLIREHAKTGMLVDEVVRKVHLSRRNLERRFEKNIGHTMWREMRRVQIEHVKNLLVSTQWPIKRVAKASAFPQPSRLTKIFREETGETPLAYRKRHQH